MIGVNAYCVACKLKSAQVFVVSIKDWKYQTAKEAKPETDLRSIVLQEYHNLLDVFSQKDPNLFPPHQKYDHKILLKE